MKSNMLNKKRISQDKFAISKNAPQCAKISFKGNLMQKTKKTRQMRNFEFHKCNE